MPPVPDDATPTLVEKRINHNDVSETVMANGKTNEHTTDKEEKVPVKVIVNWDLVVYWTLLHLVALVGLWKIISFQCAWQTVIFAFLYYSFAALGVTGGSHRLWAHKAYKAKLPLRIWLMLGQSAAFQHDLHRWVLDHRTHHRFVDTDADPHNSTRGFFFCHIGWLMTEKHPEVEKKEKTIDMSDLEADPVVMWQKKHYRLLVVLLTFLVPTYIPCFLWGEDVYISFLITVFRYTLSLNNTWFINSLAHMWGCKPYDSTIEPTENSFVSLVIYGEGWHNYHHTFPWDYKAAELGQYRLNFTAAFIDLMAWLGLAYDLKTVNDEMIKKRACRTGDGTWNKKNGIKLEHGREVEYHNFHETVVWGWGDGMTEEEITGSNITYAKSD